MGHRLFLKIIVQGIIIALIGAAVGWIAWRLGCGKDTAWTLAAVVWIIGSPLIELIATAKSRAIPSRRE